MGPGPVLTLYVHFLGTQKYHQLSFRMMYVIVRQHYIFSSTFVLMRHHAPNPLPNCFHISRLYDSSSSLRISEECSITGKTLCSTDCPPDVVYTFSKSAFSCSSGKVRIPIPYCIAYTVWHCQARSNLVMSASLKRSKDPHQMSPRRGNVVIKS